MKTKNVTRNTMVKKDQLCLRVNETKIMNESEKCDKKMDGYEHHLCLRINAIRTLYINSLYIWVPHSLKMRIVLNFHTRQFNEKYDMCRHGLFSHASYSLFT